VGWVLYDWDFGADDGVVPLAIGVVAATVAVGAAVYRRLAAG
jgi:hypothetical protein